MPAQSFIITGQQALAIVLQTPVRVNTTGAAGAQASPYNANPWDYVIADTSLGSVVINLPTLSGLGTTVTVKHDENTSLATATVTVNGPSPVLLAQPVPNNGSFSSSYQFPPAGTPSGQLQEYRGTSLEWFNGGSIGGYLLG